MKRAGLLLGVFTLFVLAAAGISGAMSHARAAGAHAGATDRVCASLIKSGRNRFSYPPDVDWVWQIPNGCVFLRDRAPTSDCPSGDLDTCTPPPDVHVRYRQRSYVFHLTLAGLPAADRGIPRRGRRMIVTADGRTPKSRRKLLIHFTGHEFRGAANPGPQHLWEISVTIDKTKGLCCRTVDPGNPQRSPWDVAPSF
jgi:hypothetical protein